MATISVSARRFGALRAFGRKYAPKLYGQIVANDTLRALFRKAKGKIEIDVGDTPKELFTAYYLHNRWDDSESLSGGGSNLLATQRIRANLPELFRTFGVRSVVDVPCGDFYWFKELKWELDKYIGADIVAPLISRNNERFSTEKRTFIVLDLTQNTVPAADLVLCRDCLIHLNNDMVIAALRNLAQSRINYVLTTNYPDCKENVEILAGQYRQINLTLPPFNLPRPIDTIDDYADGIPFRQLALWSKDQIAKPFPASQRTGS
jgi:SAM-dependent methyltransferase